MSITNEYYNEPKESKNRRSQVLAIGTYRASKQGHRTNPHRLCGWTEWLPRCHPYRFS